MTVNTRRNIVVGVILAVVVAGVIWGFMPKPIPVDVASVSKGDMQETIDEEAKTRVQDRYVVLAPVTGYMRRIPLKVGDSITKGRIVAQLEPVYSGILDPRSRSQAEATLSGAGAALRAARENVSAAESEAAYAASNRQRVDKLFSLGYISKDEMELAKSKAELSESKKHSAAETAKAAGHEYEKAEQALKFSAAGDKNRVSTVHSPIAGRILKVYRESEGVVPVGEPIVDIGNPELLEVRAEVLSSEAVNIAAGTKVILERWGGDEPLIGKVRRVEPQGFTKISSLGVEEQRVLAICDIVSPHEKWRSLGDGYRVETRFVIWEGKDVLKVPSSALFRKGSDWTVFMMDKGRARLRIVNIGHRNGLEAEIISGLNVGEKVIAYPDDSIKDGVRVKSR